MSYAISDLASSYEIDNQWGVIVDLTDLCEGIRDNELIRRVLSYMDQQDFMSYLLCDIKRYDENELFVDIYDRMGGSFTDNEISLLSNAIDEFKVETEHFLADLIPRDKKHEYFAVHQWLPNEQAVIGSVKLANNATEVSRWSQDLPSHDPYYGA